ncbi:MAG: hypothetical protein GY869_12880 [Planctomycetes bacterium]|nr:hypothetical protein [Planctomycetota bacterium]
MRKLTLYFFCALVALGGWGIGADSPHAAFARQDNSPLIQVAILLDTGAGMAPVIEQTQGQIWQIVNEVSTYRLYGKDPELQIALYEYGSGNVGAQQNYLQMLQSLTGDLDSVSESIFSLNSEDAPQYCGTVIQDAVDNLDWSTASDSIKLIFIAGAGAFDLGPIDYHSACRVAADLEIMVYMLCCGDGSDAAGWDLAAKNTGMTFQVVNGEYSDDVLEAPQDNRISELGTNLNNTFIPYGFNGQLALNNQRVQDENAGNASRHTSILRVLAKASPQYRNPQWDLVDAVAIGLVEIDTLDASDLPDKLQTMMPQQRKAYINAIGRQRSALQRQIKQLRLQRKQFLTDAGIEADPAQRDSFGGALIKFIRDQAGRKNYIIGASNQ